jgi:hypothetical protein
VALKMLRLIFEYLNEVEFPAKYRLVQQLKRGRYEAAMNTCSSSIMSILKQARNTGDLSELNHGLYPKLTLLELMIDQLRNHAGRRVEIGELPRSEAETTALIRSLRRESRAQLS